MPRSTVVIVGAALGGPAAARAAREADPKARIVLLERAAEINPVACTLPELLAGDAELPRTPGRALAAELKREHDVQVRTGQEVSALDAGRRRLTSNGKTLRYDALVWAAGAESELPPVKGLRLAGGDPAPPNAARFRTLRDLERIRAVHAEGGRRAVVLGGGYFGVEAAGALLRAGFEVTLVERGARLLPGFSAEAATAARDALAAAGVRVRLRTEIARARSARGRIASLAPSTGAELSLDLLVVAAGVRPRTGPLAEAGAAVDEDGAVIVDEHAATSLPGVFACGVCAAVPHAVTGRPTWSAQAAVAEKTARVAGACAAGADRRTGGFVGSALVRAGGLLLGRAGLDAAEAEAHAPGSVLEAAVTAPGRDPVLGGGQELAMRLLVHRRSGRLLGGEAVGTAGVAARVDALAAALAGGLDDEALASLDLGYLPEVAPVHDPLNLVAEEALRARAGS